MFSPDLEWQARDEEFHSAAIERYNEGRRAALEGAPVRGEDGWTEELEAEREALS